VVIFISNLSMWPLPVDPTNKQNQYINTLSVHLPTRKPFHNMLFTSLVVLTALSSQSTFATGILAPRAVARADAPPDGAYPLERHVVSSPQSSSRPPEVKYPNLIRGLLFNRQSTCPSGYGLCRSGGGCCPLGGACCSGGWSTLNLINGIGRQKPVF